MTAPGGSGARPEPVAVVGMGVRLPGARDTDQFWYVLNHPSQPFSEPGDRFPLSKFHRDDRRSPDRTYARVSGYIHEPGTEETEPYEIRWLRDCARQAMARVHRDPTDRAVCVVGAWPGGSPALVQSVFLDALAQQIAARRSLTPDQTDRLRAVLSPALPHARPNCPEAHDAARAAIAGLLPANTPVWTVDTACSSSLYALDLGAKHLRTGDADIALCGGVSVLEPTMAVLFSAIGGLSATGRLRAFDAEADGTLFSDAAVLLVLKTLTRARTDGDDVLGVLAGFGAAADGRGRSIAAPHPAGQSQAVERARAELGLDASAVDWIVAHATGTRAGDASELEALAGQAPDKGWICTATKSVIGHAGWAAGAASTAHALLALQHSTIPAQQHFRTPTRALGPLRIPTEHEPWPDVPGHQRVAGISAFGFGGTNAHLLIADPPPRQGDSTSHAAPRPHDTAPDDLVLVAWTAYLPGGPAPEAVRTWLTGTGTELPAAFDPAPPPFDAVGLPSPTVRAIDPTQIAALQVAHRFRLEHGELWAPVRERTGVIAAHSGVPAALLDYGLRCHADQFTDALRDHPDDLAALEDYLTVVRTRTPSAGPDAMPGVLPNVIPSRLTARYDLHGASVCVDTGATSSAIALSVAEQYLATDELELALVLALDVGAHHPMRDGAPPSVRQGAFLLALARQSTARTHGWPVVARMQSDATGSAPSATAGPGGFHAATDVVALLSALAASTEEIPTLHLPKAPPRNQRSAKRTAGPLTRRYISRRIPAPPLPSAASRTSALPAKALVLTDHAPTATALAPLAAAVGSTLWCTDPDADLALRPGPMSALTAAVDRAEGRIRVVSLPNTWPAMPAPACTELHEQLFHALGHARRRDITGSLGVVVLSPSDHPHAALFTGLVPSLLADYPELPVRVVVSDAQQPIAALDLLVREWTSTDQATATWHSNGQRHRMCLVPAPLPPPGGAGPYPVIVASGGAGGVTSTLLAALAAVTPADERPEVWILGTTDPSRLPADILQAGQNDLPALRAELIAQALRDGASSVAEAAARADRLLAGRRAAQNLHHLRATVGSNRLHYLTCDITDRRATQDAAHRVTAHHDRIDLFLHAATRSRTAPLGRKTIADFNLVRAVKVLGYHHLRDAFAPLDPGLWCNIASVAAVHPLKGEIDYGPANAFLMAAANHSDASQEITIGFPLWSESGYFAARPSLIGQIVSQGRLTGISDEEGIAHFLAELAAPRHGPTASVYLGTRERSLLQNELPDLLDEHSALLANTPRPSTPGVLLTGPAQERPDGAVAWELDLESGQHTYLTHHLVKGSPAVPGTVLLAAAAEAARELVPHAVPTTLLNASFEAFVRPSTPRARKRYTLTARETHTSPARTVHVELHCNTTVGHHTLPPIRNFSVDVVLDTAPPPANDLTPPSLLPTEPLPPDPYYFPDSPFHLTGPFVNTRRWTNTLDGPTSLWRPPEDTFSQHALLGRLTLPALLLCAVLRSRTLLPRADGLRDVVAPRRIGRITLHTDGNDHTLASAHPEGITTHYDALQDRYTATAPDTGVVLRIEGFEGAPLGSVPPPPASRYRPR